jgi:hypothetical protein
MKDSESNPDSVEKMNDKDLQGRNGRRNAPYVASSI